MKKQIAMLLCLLLCLGLAACGQTEAPEDATMVTVTIASAGELAVCAQTVAVTDLDQDGVLTISDAIAVAHRAFYPGGADGYATEMTDYGLSMQKLWGVENGGSYGYCVNDASAMSLVDPVKAGDHIKAYAYTDLTNFSDTYSYFNAPVAAAAVNTEITLTLSANGYDEAWNPVTLPVAGATLTVNGEKTDVVTDETGNAVLTLAEAGIYTVSAVSETMTLVPPVCIVTVTE